MAEISFFPEYVSMVTSEASMLKDNYVVNAV